MKHLLMAALLMVGTNAFALDKDLTCSGVDRKGVEITVKLDRWVDAQQSSRADVTIEIQGKASSLTKDMYLYGASDEGFDYGVTAQDGSWMLNIILPPNMLGNGQIAARYYDAKHRTLNTSVILTCLPGLQ